MHVRLLRAPRSESRGPFPPTRLRDLGIGGRRQERDENVRAPQEGIEFGRTCVAVNAVDVLPRPAPARHLEAEIAQALGRIATHDAKPHDADGEIVGESFQKLMKQAQRKSDVQTDGMVYHIFDIMPLDDFQRGYWNAQQYKRFDILEKARGIIEENASCLKIVSGLEVDLDTAEGHDILERYARDCVAEGFEGIMIKTVDAPYECKRSDFWMKWKPTITVDLEIVGFEQGTGRNEGRLGAIICEGVDNGRNIRVNVGSGLSDSDRDEYWLARADLLGHLVEVQADAVTQNQDGTYSLRFPRFLRFRDFEAGSKL